MPGENPIEKKELFARLAEGHAAGVTVVTPNNRLAASLRAEFDVFQAEKQLKVWEDADILPLAAFVERCHENAIYSDEGAKHLLVLSEAQAQALWESILRPSGLLAVSETAAECARAWKLAHQWRIDGVLSSEKFLANDDTRAFARWAAEYARRCEKEGWTDSARLPDRKRGLFEKKPSLLVAYGFDVVPVQTGAFLGGFDFVFCFPEKKNSSLVKTSCPSARAELEAAARWARAKVEGGAKRVGLVVPQLVERRREVLRVFARAGVPVNVSLGEPLAGYPIVDFALSVIGFSFQDETFENVSRLVRSPFLGGAEGQHAARARLDARLRRRLGHRVSLPRLIAETDGALRAHLEKLFSVEKPRKAPPHEWARIFTSLLQAAGYPGERALDSAEYQARVKFNEVLGDFAKLGVVFQKMEGGEAVQKLKNLCGAALFQPESPEAPVHALGILESAGLEFDALWVSGLTEEAWPLAERLHPFLPVAAQKTARIPQASAEDSLAFDRRITEGWTIAAQEVVFSSHDKEEDRELLPSPLIAEIPEGRVEVAPFVAFHELIFQGRKTDSVQDDNAPALQAPAVSGGTRVLADQAACPFRAFAAHRLGARELDSPAAGLDARGRGSLVHALMAALWKELKSSEALQGDVSKAISKAASRAVEEMQLQGEFARMEKARLEKLALDWLELERSRAPFEVVATERDGVFKVGKLELKGRIDRLDRLLDGETRGSHVVIDYKSGERVNPDDWMGERPREPQLAIYATRSEERVGAVAFARLKAGKLRFAGFSRGKDVIPGVKAARSWPALLEGWDRELARLAGQFEAGEARVDPRAPAASTCSRCDLETICRVHERFTFLDEPAGEDE